MLLQSYSPNSANGIQLTILGTTEKRVFFLSTWFVSCIRELQKLLTARSFTTPPCGTLVSISHHFISTLFDLFRTVEAASIDAKGEIGFTVCTLLSVISIFEKRPEKQAKCNFKWCDGRQTVLHSYSQSCKNGIMLKNFKML